jgi:hypothetical protein
VTIDIEDVCTHAQLDDYLMGKLSAQVHLLPPTWAGDSVLVRRQGLTDVLSVLRDRTPPIFENDISDPSELRQCVIHYAASRLYDNAMTSGADAEVFHAKMRAEERRYRDRVNALRPTLAGVGNVTAPALSVGISRR